MMALIHIEGIKEYLKQSEINFHRIRIISFCFKHSFGIKSTPGAGVARDNDSPKFLTGGQYLARGVEIF